MDVRSTLKAGAYTVMIGAATWLGGGCDSDEKYQQLEEQVEQLEKEKKEYRKILKEVEKEYDKKIKELEEKNKELERAKIPRDIYQQFEESTFYLEAHANYEFNYDGATPHSLRRMEGKNEKKMHGSVFCFYGADEPDAEYSYFLGVSHTVDPQKIVEVELNNLKKKVESKKEQSGKGSRRFKRLESYIDTLEKNIENLPENFEILDREIEYQLPTESGGTKSRDLELVSLDQNKDIALFRSKKPVDADIDKLMDPEKMYRGRRIINAGFPPSLKGEPLELLENGIVLGKNKNSIYSNLDIEGGDSGGPAGGEYRDTDEAAFAGPVTMVNRSALFGKTQSLFIRPEITREFLEENGFKIDEDTREIKKVSDEEK